MTEPGSTTAEIRPIPAATPDRPAGRRALIGGLILAGFVYLASLAAAIIDENGIFASQAAQIFAILGVMTLGCASAALIVSGHNARQQQKQQALHEAAVAEQKRMIRMNQLLLERLSIDTDERYRDLIGHVAALPGRVHEVQERLNTLDDLTKLLEDTLGRVKRIEQTVAPELDPVDLIQLGIQMQRGAEGPDKP